MQTRSQLEARVRRLQNAIATKETEAEYTSKPREGFVSSEIANLMRELKDAEEDLELYNLTHE